MTDEFFPAALRLTVDVVGGEDRTSVSYATLRENYIFAGFAQESRTLPRDRLQRGTMIAVASSLKEFIEEFQFLTRVDLLSICDRHCIAVGNRLCLKGLRDVLRVHACTGECHAAPYAFRQLSQRRRVHSNVHKVAPVGVDDYVGNARQGSRRRMQESREHRRACKTVDALNDGVEDCLEFPPHRSFDQKEAVIKEWQERMNPSHLKQGLRYCRGLMPLNSITERFCPQRACECWKTLVPFKCVIGVVVV
ncbi:hypothetical protein BKA82DRAFT_4016616 [Pisolithus tinctorius]|nr:hypothetical protein BKA82DRAFT_4016616 [Pisolithus tinctorius]